MKAKIIASIITFVGCLFIGIAIFFVMLIGMNGYSESDASWGFGFFCLASIVIAIFSMFGAYQVSSILIGRDLNIVLSVILSILTALLFAGVAMIFAGFVGVVISDWIRVNY